MNNLKSEYTISLEVEDKTQNAVQRIRNELKNISIGDSFDDIEKKVQAVCGSLSVYNIIIK